MTPKDLLSLAERISVGLRGAGHGAHAERLTAIVRDQGWTTSSELIGELGLALLDIRRELRLRDSLRHDIDVCLAAVREVWPDIGRR